MTSEGFSGLTEFIAREEIHGEDLQMWGRIHPAMMGGEYLPALGSGEVEIARISLASTTGDQISIRARPEQGGIRYRVVDEYESIFQLPFESSAEPLTLGELIRFIDEAKYDDSYPSSGGLMLCHLNANYDAGAEFDEIEEFMSIESAFYPELESNYESVLGEWFGERRPVEDLEEDTDE